MSLRELDLRDYGDWPLSHRTAACLLLALLSFSLPWLGLTRSTSAERQALNVVEHDLQTRLQHARQQVDALPPLRPDAAEPATSLAPDIPALITAIAGTAQAAGLHGGQFRPAPAPAAEAGREAIPMALRLSGDWTQLHRFASELSAPTWDAILSLREIHLRAPALTASAPVLELSATLWIHPRPVASVIPVSERFISNVPPRNPFINTATHERHARPQVVIGHLGHGGGHVGLVLTADGELQRVHARTH